MESIVEFVNGIIWSNALIFMCLGAGLWFTLRTRFMQIRGFAEMCRLTVRGQKSDAKRFRVGCLPGAELSWRCLQGEDRGVAERIELICRGERFEAARIALEELNAQRALEFA